MHQPKAGGTLRLYGANSSNARNNAKSKRGHKMIVRTGWRLVVIIFALNCMHMQALVQVLQVVAKTALLQ